MVSEQFDPASFAGLAKYLKEMQQQRFEQLMQRLDGLTSRERTLVHEAAVMGWVLGVMRAGGGEEHIPHDAEILVRVVSSCMNSSDLYPMIGQARKEDSQDVE